VYDIVGIDEWRGADIVASDGEKVGKVEDVLYDASAGDAKLLLVKSGRIGSRHALVPLRGASFGRNAVRVAFPSAQVAAAPAPGSDGVVHRAEEQELARHYGLSAPDVPGADDTVRYETATVVQQRRDAVEGALRRAEELEASAARMEQEAAAQAGTAARAQQQALAAAAERQRLLAEATALRSRAADAAVTAGTASPAR